MKVLYVCNDGNLSGSTIALRNLLSPLMDYGIEPVFICKSQGAFTDWLEVHGFEYYIVNFPWCYYRDEAFVPAFIGKHFKARRYRKEESKAIYRFTDVVWNVHPDLIHSNNSIIHVGYEVAQKLSIPHLWHLREYQTLDFGFNPIPSMEAFRHKLQNSYSVAITRDIYDFYAMSENCSRVIYDGVLPLRGTCRIKQKENYFLFVGYIDYYKGVDELISAFIEFAKNDSRFKLFLAGNSHSGVERELKRRVDRAGLSERVRFLGFRNDRLELMQRAKAVIVPSRCEGFGFITVEAMFNGTVVIGRNRGGTKEIAVNTPGSILLYDTGEQLVRQMHRVADAPLGAFDEMETLAQESASRLYCVEQSASQLDAYYKSVLLTS